MVRKHYRFTGRVQGVGFRYRAKHAAGGMCITGWVKNEWDGSVEMEVQGTEEAINRMLGMDIKLESFSLNAVTDGEDAIGEAVVKVTDSNGESYTGTGLSTDILESSIRAYVNSINKIIEAGTAPD